MRNTSGSNKINVLPLREQAYNYLKNLILTNQLYPGQTVVVDQLVKQMGVSHTPLREALMLLELEGLVITNRYKSLQVTPITKDDVYDIYEMRELLEGWSARKIAETCEEKDLDILKDILGEAEEINIEDDYSRLIDLDIEFHNTINELVSNTAFLRIMYLLKDQAVRVRSLVEASHTSHWEKTIIKEHRDILEAIIKRDGDQAHKRMVFHLRSAMQRTLDALDVFEKLQNESSK